MEIKINYFQQENFTSLTLTWAYKNYLVRIRKLEEEYLSKYSRKPTQEEIIKELGINQKIMYYCNVAASKVVSADSLMYTDSDMTIGDCLKDEDDEIETCNEECIIERLYDVIEGSTLDDREKYIIYSRYGFDGDLKSLKEIAEKLEISCERVRQIESRALQKLKKQLNDLEIDINYEAIEKAADKQKSR